MSWLFLSNDSMKKTKKIMKPNKQVKYDHNNRMLLGDWGNSIGNWAVLLNLHLSIYTSHSTVETPTTLDEYEWPEQSEKQHVWMKCFTLCSLI